MNQPPPQPPQDPRPPQHGQPQYGPPSGSPQGAPPRFGSPQDPTAPPQPQYGPPPQGPAGPPPSPPYGSPPSPQYGPPAPQYGPPPPRPAGPPQYGPPQYGPPPISPPSDPGRWETPDFDYHTADSIRDQVFNATGNAQPARTGGGTMFTEPVLVVSQRTKLIELNNEYRVFDQNGNPLGTVVQIGQSTLKKVVRFIGDYDQFFTHTLEVRNIQGQPLMRLTRPRKILKSRLLVEAPNGPIGELVQQNVFGKIRFDMIAGGQSIGSINAENWRAWNFAILDSAGREVGRITKNFEGIARTLFTTADNYVVQIHFQLPDPLRSMVVAAALCVDTALKQDSRGFN